jgi:hypothetical protein
MVVCVSPLVLADRTWLLCAQLPNGVPSDLSGYYGDDSDSNQMYDGAMQSVWPFVSKATIFS